jgi:hypothetical protein
MDKLCPKLEGPFLLIVRQNQSVILWKLAGAVSGGLGGAFNAIGFPCGKNGLTCRYLFPWGKRIEAVLSLQHFQL